MGVQEVAKAAVEMSTVRMIGMPMHIGSQITSTVPYAGAIAKGVELIGRLRGLGRPISWYNMGGGYGISYKGREDRAVEKFAKVIVPEIKSMNRRLAIEPGRVIAGNAGILVSRVVYTKQSGEKRFLIQDAAMNDLIRPALYESFHRIWPVVVPAGTPSAPDDAESTVPGTEPWDVVGPVCESGDFLAKDRPLPPLDRGALLAIFSAGAYGMVMASNYNTSPRAAEVLVDQSRTRVWFVAGKLTRISFDLKSKPRPSKKHWTFSLSVIFRARRTQAMCRNGTRLNCHSRTGRCFMAAFGSCLAFMATLNMPVMTGFGLRVYGQVPGPELFAKEPRTSLELWDAIDYLVQTNQVKKALPYLDKFMKSKPDDATLIAIRNRFGAGSILRLSDDPLTRSFAKPLTEALVAAAQVCDATRANCTLYRRFNQDRSRARVCDTTPEGSGAIRRAVSRPSAFARVFPPRNGGKSCIASVNWTAQPFRL